MIEILEKVSDQIKKVEKIHSGSIPVLEGEYDTPPVSQMKVNKPGKLSPPPNLPIYSGQEPVPSTAGLIDQWLFQEIHYGEEMSAILRHIKKDLDKGLQKPNFRRNFS